MTILPQPHTLTVVTPTETTDGYGDTVLDYANGSRRDIRAFVQPATGQENKGTERDSVRWGWVAHTMDRGVGARDRAEWRARTYEIDGPHEAWYAMTGRFGHVKLRLFAVEG